MGMILKWIKRRDYEAWTRFFWLRIRADA